MVETEPVMSHKTEITFISEHYFFLKTSSLTQIESNQFRRKKLEQKVRKAVMKFSKHYEHSLTNYLLEEQNEIIAWINIAIAECGKGRKQDQRGSF